MERGRVHKHPTSHRAVVAADESAARILTRDAGHRLRISIEKTLTDDDVVEAGFSIAWKDNFRYITTPATSGYEQSVSFGVPSAIDADGKDLPPRILVKPNRGATTNKEYDGLVKTHTHPVHDHPSVGLSGTDLSDSMPGPDKYARSVPFNIYRAQSAVVFTNTIERTPHETPPPGGWDKSLYVFDTCPEYRPWLHLVERTPTATQMEKHKLARMHDESLNTYHDDSDTYFTAVRELLGEAVAELFVPLAPRPK